MTRAVVTGAGGFIGRRLVALLRAEGIETIGWTHAEVPLEDAPRVAAAMTAARPDTVFHLASSGVAPDRQVAESIAADVAMTANLIAALPDEALLVQAGSMAEYGASGRLREDMPAAPTTFYGRAKLAASECALARGGQVCVARIFGAYGPGEAPGRLVPALVDRLPRGQSVALSDGAQRRDFVQVDDVCRALIRLAAIEHPAPRIVNIGTGRAITLRAACERIADLFGADRGLLDFGAFPRRATDQDVLEADTALLAALTGEVPPQHLLDADDATLARLIGASGVG